MKVPFADLKTQYLDNKVALDEAIQSCLNSTSFIGGEKVKEFEKAFADFVKVDHCIGCANGTDSLEILLQAYDIGPGDEVLIPTHTWISTAEAVSFVGATPVFADCDSKSYTIKVDEIEALISERTKVIIPVHLYGYPAPMTEIMELAKKHNIIVIEDCAQAHGATVKGKPVGSIGHAGSFSFYPGKNLGAYGDAGAMVTNDKKIAQKARMIANHGQPKKHDHQLPGRNSRLDTLHASVLSVKLPLLPKWTAQRQSIASGYKILLSDLKEIQLPFTEIECTHVYHLYVIQAERRDELMHHLNECGISTGIHYPEIIPLTKAYQENGTTRADFPESGKYIKNILSLPMFPEMDEEQIAYVAEKIKEFYR